MSSQSSASDHVCYGKKQLHSSIQKKHEYNKNTIAYDTPAMDSLMILIGTQRIASLPDVV
jgi:hypothetical protein